MYLKSWINLQDWSAQQISDFDEDINRTIYNLQQVVLQQDRLFGSTHYQFIDMKEGKELD